MSGVRKQDQTTVRDLHVVPWPLSRRTLHTHALTLTAARRLLLRRGTSRHGFSRADLSAARLAAVTHGIVISPGRQLRGGYRVPIHVCVALDAGMWDDVKMQASSLQGSIPSQPRVITQRAKSQTTARKVARDGVFKSIQTGVDQGLRRSNMGVFNEQGNSLEEPESRHMLIRGPGAPTPQKDQPGPLALRRQHCKVAPRDVLKETMLAVGGWTQDEPSCPVEQFYPEYNEWRMAAPMVNRRGNVAVGTLDGKVYTAGGQDSIRCYDNVERYDPHTDVWSVEIAPLCGPRTGVCLLEMDGYLYAIGGWDGIAASSTVERYDPTMNSWSRQASMRTRRSRAGAAVLGGHLYVMGGHDGDMVLNSVERYSPEDGSWSICPPMRSPREGAGCTAYLGRIYVAGGRDELHLDLSAVERFDPDAMRWSPAKRMSCKRNQVSLVVFNGALLAVGGSDGVVHLKTMEVYNPENNAWRHHGSMRSKHPGGRLAVLS
ncbi:unnamed protein product [Lota lota]